MFSSGASDETTIRQGPRRPLHKWPLLKSAADHPMYTRWPYLLTYYFLSCSLCPGAESVRRGGRHSALSHQLRRITQLSHLVRALHCNVFILCFMFRPSSAKSSVVLCYNINKHTYLLAGWLGSRVVSVLDSGYFATHATHTHTHAGYCITRPVARS